MEELEEAGWESNREINEDISYKEVKAMFEQADTARRDLVAVPTKVRENIHERTFFCICFMVIF